MKIYYHKELLFQETEDKINTLEIIKSWHELSTEGRIFYWGIGAFYILGTLEVILLTFFISFQSKQRKTNYLFGLSLLNVLTMCATQHLITKFCFAL